MLTILSFSWLRWMNSPFSWNYTVGLLHHQFLLHSLIIAISMQTCLNIIHFEKCLLPSLGTLSPCHFSTLLLQHYLKKLSILPIFSLLPSTYSYHIFIFITPPKSFLPRSLRTNILLGQMGILHCLPILILSGIWHVHHLFLLKTFSSWSSVPQQSPMPSWLP